MCTLRTTHCWLIIGFLITAFTPVSRSEAQNLIVNGSFESPGFATENPYDAVFTLTPGTTNVTGWVVGDRGAFWINSKFPDPSWRPPDGGYFMDLSSFFDDDIVGGSISQILSTRPGFTYMLSFEMAGENANAPTPAVLSVTAGSASYTFTLPTTTNVTWVRQTLIFTADTDTTLINFADITANPDSNTLLDSVAVTLDTNAPARLSVRSRPNQEGFELGVFGEIGRSYRIQVSADLRTWADLFSFSNTERETLFLDSDAGRFSRRFYRVVSP